MSEPPSGDQSSGPAAELMEVLLDRLGPQADAGTMLQGRIEAVRALRQRRSRKRRGARQLDPELAALFGLVIPGPSNLEQLTPEIVGLTQRGFDEGLPRDALPAVFQAYVRAVSRIASAEATVLAELLARTPPEEHAARVANTIDSLLPIGARGFDVLHRMLLLDALADAVAGIDQPPDERDVLAIAMVDLVGSTQYLSTSTPSDLEQLVDALFAAGQTATANRSAHVVKYVGDGLFVAGRDVTDVADAALEMIARLGRDLPLRARGGLASGAVVQRAGDVFGLPINVAHIATKAARTGTLLATEAAARQLPQERRGRFRTVRMAHPAIGKTRVATIHPAVEDLEPAAN
jgi:class 3 adenylate cyclase